MPLSPLVFVHGLFGPFADARTFAELAPAHCSAPDLRGYGAAAGEAVTVDGQVEALRDHVDRLHGETPVVLVAHSIGAVYAFRFADESPERVAGVVTVEGNFSLADAFWSRSLAAMAEAEARTEIEARLADPAAFLASDGIEPSERLQEEAASALAFQPWRTVWESARAVVEETASPQYEARLRRVFGRTAVSLVAGSRSAAGWDVPGWARREARGDAMVPEAGHLMMLERPEQFGHVLREILLTV